MNDVPDHRALHHYAGLNCSVRFLDVENALVRRLTAVTGSQRRALETAGVARSTWHYRSNPRERAAEPIPQKERAYPSRISDTDRAVVAERITAG